MTADQRFFWASEIRRRASALIWRLLREPKDRTLEVPRRGPSPSLPERIFRAWVSRSISASINSSTPLLFIRSPLFKSQPSSTRVLGAEHSTRLDGELPILRSCCATVVLNSEHSLSQELRSPVLPIRFRFLTAEDGLVSTSRSPAGGLLQLGSTRCSEFGTGRGKIVWLSRIGIFCWLSWKS